MKTTLRKFSRIFIGTILFFFVGLNKSEAQGASLAFNGSNDYVQVSSLNFGNNWTAEAWIYPTNVGGVNWKTALGQSYWNGPSGFVIAIASNSVFLEGPQGFHIGYPVTANVWSHVAATYNNGIFAFYVNGVLAGVQTGTFTNSTAPFFIGSRNDNNVTNNSSMMDAFTGRIDEIRIWNTTRSQCDIQSHMNSEIPTTQSGLVANYHFNQCSGTYIIDVLAGATCSSLDDATGNGNTGTFSSVLLSIGLSPVWNTGGSPAQGVTTPASANTSEIDITGNGNSIADGSAVPSTTNHTNFNGAFTRTFVISNSGSQVLSVGVPVLTGTAASQFSVTTVPASTLAATSGSTSFVVTFNPNSTGVKNATLNVYNLDCSEPFYSFAITATAVAGGALDFYGNSGTGEDYVTAADPIIGTSDCTIETWFKQTSTSGGYLVSNRSYEGGPGGYWWAVNISGGVNQGQVGIELGDAGGIGYTGISSAPGLFALNTWNHVAVVRSGTIITVYLNGVSVATATDSGVRNWDTPYDILHLGGWPEWDGAWFTGALDETRIWKVARTQCEIQTFMNCEVVSTPTTLVANYHFNQGVDQGSNLSVNTLTDASGSIRTGTLSAFDLTGLTSNWIGNGAVVSNYTTFTTPNVEIDVRGAGNSIIDGNTSTSPVDYTDFNGALTRTYTIHNLNSAALAIGVPYFTGTDANQFSVTTLPPASLAGSSSVAIVVAFTPTSTGVKTATFNIPNSDCDEPLYDFRIVATPPAAEALNFNGGTQYVETGSNLLELGLSDFTIETWIKTTGNDMGILTCSDGDGTWEPGEKSLLIENDGHLEFVGYGCDFIHASQTYSVNDGNWHHVAITWDLQSSPNGIGKIYIDGVDRTSSSTYTANTTNLGTFKIGLQNYGESTLNFSGTMDEFRIWNVARSQCEIQSYMQCEITNTLTNLLANYHFNQGAPFLNNSSVTTLTDAAAVPHTGTLTNFVLTGSVSNWVSPGGIVSGSVTPASITASLIVSGNGNNVPSGIVTTTLNNTDFAANPSRSFSITNAGGGTLNIGSIYFTGPAAAQFSVTSSPSLAVTTGTTGFTIAYTPTALGSFSAVVNISTNDCINPTYSFVVTASTIPASALNFDGTNDFVALSSGTNIPLGNSPYTIESWIKPTAFGDCGIVGWGNYGTTNEVNGFRLGVGGLLINYWWGNDLMATVPTLTNGSWHHVAATFDGVIRVLYVDGVTVASDMPSGHNVPSTANLKIGVTCTTPACSGGPEYFNGGIDELRIWNIGLTQCEIQTYMNCEIPSTAPGLVANYHFNQGIPSGTNTSITTLIDATGSNTGTLNNFTLIGSTSNWVSPGGVVNDYTLTSPPTATISLSGNGNNVPVGVTTTTLNNTDFGTNPSRTFSIANSGGGTLTVGSIYFTGANASEFSVTTAPASSLTTGVSSFVIAHTPTAIGSASAVVNILSNDCVNPTYSFVITASTNIADALSFNGSDYISLPNIVPATFTNNVFTLECWVKFNSLTTWQTLMKNWGDSFGGAFHFGLNGTGQKLEIIITQTNNASPGIADPANMVTNVWTHVAAVADGSYIRLYKNGVQVASGAYDGTIKNSFAPLFIGAKPNDSGSAASISVASYLNGSMDEVRIWNVARNQCEIQQYMNCEIPSTAPGLIANYHFNQGIPSGANSTQTVLTDAVGSNTGTLNTFVLSGTTSNWISTGGVISGSTTPASITATVVINGNGNNVPMGVITSTSNNTDFATNPSRTFSITNSGTGTLNLSGIYFTGANASQFSVTTNPASAITTGTTGFVIAYTPTSTSSASAVVNIVSNDCVNPTYSFVITASTTPASALSFNGLNNYVQTNIDCDNDVMPNLTWEAWIKPTVNDATYRQLLSIDDGGWDRFLGMNSGSVIIGTGSEWSPATFTINQWQHVALVYTASDVRFYLNGVEHYTTTAQSLGMTTSKFLIGCRNSPIAEFAAAQFDEVRVWNTARTQCEIQTYMNAEITSTASGLVANYHFNQGIPSGSNTAVTSLTDAAGSNTGTLTSFVLTGSVSNWVSPGGVISGSTTPAPPTSSILVSGNSNSITPGSTVTSTLNFTDFGTAVTRTFVIQNSNLGVLNIASPYFTGTNAADFLVTTLPSESLAASATTSFVITFSPSANGVKNATLNISNNSCGIPLFNCAITATPPTASGLSFSGASNYVSVSGHTLNGQSFTIEFYAQRTSTLTNDFIYGQGVSTTNGGLHIGFYDHSISDNLVFDFWNDAISATNSDFNWHHWACVYDASAPAGAKNRFIYRDGVIAAMDTYTGTYTGTGTSYIGTTPWSIVGDAFEGNLDEMRVWSIARSQCEIQTYMNCEIPAAAPGLISNYHFNQGSPGLNNSGINTLVDVSSTPHTGTLSGFALTGSVSNWISPSAIALNYTNTAVPNASFVISGNGNNVPVGATTSTTNFTDFGTNTTRTFVIANPGSAPLYVNTGYVTGANASNFIVTATPGSVIAGGSSDNLVITFSPTALGTASAILNIVSSDCTYPTYSFVITATAVPADALAFSGSAEYVALPVMDFSATNKLTFEAWVKPTDITSSGYFQIMRQDIAISNPHWLVSFQDFGTTLSFGLNTSSGGYTELDVPITPSYFTDGNWHHIAAVYDGSTKRLYVDGVQAGLETKSGSIVTGAVVHSLGRANYYGEFFKGTMDEVRYWNVARTQCEILSYMNCEMSGTPTGLVANYHFTQGIPFGTNTLVTTAIDAMGANNGTLTSFVLTGSVSNWVSPGGVISGSTTPATLSQTLNVKGNGNNVPMGTSTSTNNFTDFSTNSVRTFVAENIGSGTLYISNVSFSGAGASQFSVGSAPASSLAGSGSSSFTILFTPTVVGTSSAIVTVNSSDCSNPNYSFVITASASPASALHFDGGSGYVDLGAGSNLKPTVALTAEAWINAGNWPSVDQTFVGNTESNGWGILTTNVSGNLEGYVRRNGSWATVGTPLSGITAGWHHVALTYDGRYTKLYVDGIMKNMNDAGATYTVDYNPFNNTLIGAEASSGSSPVPGWAFTGSIDELRIWSTARTQCEILTYMNCEIPTTTTNLVANYHFNQGIPSGSNTAVTTLTDAAGSNTGTLVNVTLTGSVSNWVAPSVFANGYTLTSQPTATLTITGNGNAINPGSTATGTNNFTDFGSASTRTFVANNIASSGVLYINTVSISGGNAADFTLTTAPVSSVNASGNTNFVITFTPTALGTRTAIVSLFSSDCSNPVYSFVITASASPASALDFDNNNDYVNLGNGLTTLFDPLNTITLEAWVKPTSTVGLGSIVGNWQSPTSVMQFLLQRSGDKFCLHIDGGTGYQSLFSAPNTVSLNTWQHVAGVWDGSQMRLYINGVLQGVLTNTGSSFPTRSNNVMIGGNNVNEQLTGSIDEVRVWTLPRTQCEILQYMNCEITSTASGLVANYHFNQGLPSGNNLTENLLTDATGIYTGTLTNMNLTGNTSNWISPGGVLSGSTTPAVLNQTISLLGNGNAIPVGSSTGTLNFTDFGSSTNRVYTIHNSGTGVLHINPVVSITGAGAGDFSLSAIPASSISGTGNATFAISFIPSSLGTKTAVVTVESSDCTIPSYSFVISASPSSGAALNFDGSTGFASATVFNTNTNNITLQAKVLYTANTATNQVIVYNGNTSSSGYGMFVGQNGDLYLLYGGNTSPSLNYTITPNVWTYLSLVIESNKISFYVNGVSTTTLDPLIVGSPNVPTSAFCIGANHLGLEVFNGTIDEVLFWTRPLSQCEIQAYAFCEISGTLTGLEANYHFNQGIASGVNSTVTTLTDASSNAHDLLLYGMTLSGPTSNWVTPGAVTSGSSCSTYSAPEIAVVGGTTSLGSGDVLPSVGKDTDYGNISTSGNIVHTFTIQNSGNGSLSVSSITMSGADASSYLVGPLIPSSPIAAGNFAVFNVTFAPSGSGTKTAMVNINNSDCDEALFTYMLTGSGAGGQSFVFDGVDDYITCGNILTASYTKEAWIKIGTSTNGNNFISTGTGVTGSAFWAPGIYGYKLSAGHDGLWNQVQDATALSTNTWYHVAVTYDAPSTTMSLYKNGVLVASSNTVQPYTGSTPLQLGAYDGTYVVNGSMDEVRVWNRALCASEIVNNMSCEIQTIGTGLVANYHFNQGIGYGSNATQTTVTDFSGASNTGTIVNAALTGTLSNWQYTSAVTSGSFCPAIVVPEINLVGNGVSIADGKTVSATSDHTDFGSVCENTVMVRTYTVQNTGAGPLSISNMSMSGTNASLFTIGSLSPSSPVAAGSSAVFSVTFSPASAGTKTAALVIGNDDCTESIYDFVLTGTCNALPVVTATASGSVICNGATVTLNGGGADTYTWTGGTPTVTDNVAFTPSTTLSYTVSGTNALTGCTSTNIAVQGITVNPSPTIAATVSSSVICAGATATVFPTNANTYTLLPGPLSGTSIVISPAANTTYTLSGTSSSGCNSFNNIPITITVNALPTVTANATNSMVCDGFTTSVFGSGADTYTWTGGVTNSVSFVPTASQDYTVTGTYTLTGCVSTNVATQSIVVNALPSVTASAINSVICEGTQATLTASGATNYTWLPGPVFGNSVTVSPTSLTVYTVTGTSTANCTSTNLATQSISVNALPTVTANISSSLVCEGGSITVTGAGADTYTWTGGVSDGVTFTVSTNTSYSVNGTNTLTGCTSTNNAAVTISVNSLPTITVNVSDPAICIGDQVTLSAGGGTSYVWSGTVTDNVAFSPTVTSDYTVTGTDANSCVNSSIVTVTVNNLPVLSVLATNSLNCEAQNNTLTVSGASTYTWSGGETTESIVITPTTTTNYTVSGVDANGCLAQFIHTQSVTPCSDTILLNAVLVDESCKGKANGSIVLSFTTSQQNYQTSYYWSEPTLCPNNDCDSVSNLKAGNYTVTVKITYTLNSTLVRSDSTSQSFEIKNGSDDCVLKVYSGITRNGDGENEFMYIENIEQYPNNSIMVFTRWGEQVYTMKGYNNVDRTWPIEGELSKLSSNTYFYVLDPGDGGKVLKGWIELIK